MDHVKHLSKEIGPRPPTSYAEAEAAAYCARILEQAGAEVTIEEFQGLRSFGHIYIPTTLGSLVAALAGTDRKFRPWAPLLGVASMVAFYGEQTSRFRPVTKALSMRKSQNVIGVLPPKGEVLRRLIVVAHVDSSRSGWAFHPKVAKDFRRNTLIGIAAGIASVVAWALPQRLRRWISGLSSIVLANSLAFLIQREIAGEDVAGANDNASGAGTALALAEHLSQEPLSHTQVWFVITGCEESDLVGMSAFIEKHGDELQDAVFLNLDTVAGPETTLRWITHSSIVEPLAADQELISLAEKVAASRPDLAAGPGEWRAAGLDTDVAGVRGIRQMSLVAQTQDGRLPNWHWPTDTYENIDEKALGRAFEFTRELIRLIDAG